MAEEPELPKVKWPDGPNAIASFDQAFAEYSTFVNRMIKGVNSDPDMEQYAQFKELCDALLIARGSGWSLVVITATAIMKLAEING